MPLHTRSGGAPGPTSSAGPSELEGGVCSERGFPTSVTAALWVAEGAWAWPALSVGARAVAPAALLPPLEPAGGLGEAAEPPAPPPHSLSAPCLAGIHRSTSGTLCHADGSTRPPSWASGASSGSGSGSESSLLLPLLLSPPLSPSLSPLLELHRTVRRGRRRPRPRLCCFCGEGLLGGLGRPQWQGRQAGQHVWHGERVPSDGSGEAGRPPGRGSACPRPLGEEPPKPETRRPAPAPSEAAPQVAFGRLPATPHPDHDFPLAQTLGA